MSHKRIRRVSIDQFYALVTGQHDAFYQICMVLPEVVSEVLSGSSFALNKPHDTVYDELEAKAENLNVSSPDTAMVLSMYMLGFSTYDGFKR